MDSIKSPSQDIFDERHVVPSKISINAFIKSFSSSLATFIKNNYTLSLSRLVEDERRDKDVDSICTAMASLLGMGSDIKDLTNMVRRTELVALVSSFVDRVRSSSKNIVTNDFAAKALMHLLDTLVSVVSDMRQDSSKKKSIMDALGTQSDTDWQMAVMAIAIRRPKHTNATLPLEFRATLVFDDDNHQAGQVSLGPKIGMYSFAMEVIKQWIETTKSGSDMLNAQSAGPMFSQMAVQLFSTPHGVEQGIRVACAKVLTKYADQYVGESPNGAAVIADKQTQLLRRAGRAKEYKSKSKPSRALTEDMEMALKYGLSATEVIALAADAGYYYGSTRQINMYRNHEARVKDKAMEEACKMVAEKMERDAQDRHNNLLTQFGRMMSASSSQMTVAPLPQQSIAANGNNQMQVVPLSTNFTATPNVATNSGISQPAQNNMVHQQQTTPIPSGTNQSHQPYHIQIPQAPYAPASAPVYPNLSGSNIRSGNGIYGEYPSMATTAPPNAWKPSPLPLGPNSTSPHGPYPQHQSSSYPAPPHLQQQSKQVSFASAYLNQNGKSFTSGYTSPPPPNSSNGHPHHRPNASPMTQNFAKRKPAPAYEDSSGESDSSASSYDTSSDSSLGDSSGSDFSDSGE